MRYQGPRWEFVQPAPLGPLSTSVVRATKSVLDTAQAAGTRVILALNVSSRRQAVRTADGPLLADLWSRLAGEFAGHSGLYGYELLNEPHGDFAAQNALPDGDDSWGAIAQVVTDAIRGRDTTAWIVVPGVDYQNSMNYFFDETWLQRNRALDVKDPSGKLLYSAHQYFPYFAADMGMSPHTFDEWPPCRGCPPGLSTDLGDHFIKPFRDWLAKRDARGLVTEYAVPDNDTRWLELLDRFLAVLDADPHIVGGTYFVADPFPKTAPQVLGRTGGWR